MLFRSVIPVVVILSIPDKTTPVVLIVEKTNRRRSLDMHIKGFFSCENVVGDRTQMENMQI